MAKIKKFNVVKMASFMGLYGVFIGIIAGLIVTLSSLVGGALLEEALGIFKFVYGTLSIIIFPIFYGFMMFLAGLIFTPIINLVLKIIKGIDLDIEMQEQTQVQQQPVQTPQIQ